jgi:hypothetical protein
MKNYKKTIALVILLIALLVLGVLLLNRDGFPLTLLDMSIIAVVVILGGIAAYQAFKKDRDLKLGIPVDDELSDQIKYKAGYYAFVSSMYMWLFIFLLKDLFPDVESMIGGGILLSALISVVIKFVIKKNIHAK